MKGGSQKLDSLRAQRLAAGHSIQTLAKKANVSELTIQQLENGGNDDPWIVQRIAHALGVSTATLGAKNM
jgi:DNA-binding XRE family transcriptional regulator